MQTLNPATFMPHRLIDFCDSVVLGLMALVATISTIVVTGSPWDEMQELRILMVPFCSGLVATGGLYLFNIGKEPRNVVLGRALFGLLLGASAIPVVALFWTSAEPILRRPIILLPGGAVCVVCFYYLSYPLARGFMNRSNGLADQILDEAQRRVNLPVPADKTLREVKLDAYQAGKDDQKVITKIEDKQP